MSLVVACGDDESPADDESTGPGTTEASVADDDDDDDDDDGSSSDGASTSSGEGSSTSRRVRRGGAGGLDAPGGMVFGPDGVLHVASVNGNTVLRFDGEGEPLPTLVDAAAAGIAGPTHITIAPALSR